MLGPLRRDEGNPRRLCFAKKAAAFFNISRAAAVSPVFPLVRSARACATQLRRNDSVNPKSRAPAATVLASSRTRRTAPVLYASAKLRRVRLLFVSAVVDIVSAFRIVSTKPAQCQPFVWTATADVILDKVSRFC